MHGKSVFGSCSFLLLDLLLCRLRVIQFILTKKQWMYTGILSKRQTYFRTNKTGLKYSNRSNMATKRSTSQDFKPGGSFDRRQTLVSLMESLDSTKILKKKRERKRRRCRKKINPFQCLENVDFHLNGSLAEFCFCFVF